MSKLAILQINIKLKFNYVSIDDDRLHFLIEFGDFDIFKSNDCKKCPLVIESRRRAFFSTKICDKLWIFPFFVRRIGKGSN